MKLCLLWSNIVIKFYFGGIDDSEIVWESQQQP
jgi:hypothetical protein